MSITANILLPKSTACLIYWFVWSWSGSMASRAVWKSDSRFWERSRNKFKPVSGYIWGEGGMTDLSTQNCSLTFKQIPYVSKALTQGRGSMCWVEQCIFQKTLYPLRVHCSMLPSRESRLGAVKIGNLDPPNHVWMLTSCYKHVDVCFVRCWVKKAKHCKCNLCTRVPL